MERKEDDRRVRKTKARLREALVELLREKRVEEITVTELTRRADVNRGTFYCHYRDVHQMVEQLEERLRTYRQAIASGDREAVAALLAHAAGRKKQRNFEQARGDDVHATF